MDLNERDEICMCGTSTGDVMKIKLNFHHDAEVLEPVKPPVLLGCFSKMTRAKLERGTVELYHEGRYVMWIEFCEITFLYMLCVRKGVRSIKVLHNNRFLIGAGDGTVDLVEERKAPVLRDPPKMGFKTPCTPCLKVVRNAHTRGC